MTSDLAILLVFLALKLLSFRGSILFRLQLGRFFRTQLLTVLVFSIRVDFVDPHYEPSASVTPECSNIVILSCTHSGT